MTDLPGPKSAETANAQLVRTYLLAFIGLALCYRLGVLLTLDVPLFYDEAYYFGWAEHLAFGYFSKPPMVAWSIALTSTFSESTWAVRLASPLRSEERRVGKEGRSRWSPYH